MKKKLAEEKAAAKKNFEEELHKASEGVPDLLTLPDRGWDPDHVLAQVGLCVLTVLNLPDRIWDPDHVLAQVGLCVLTVLSLPDRGWDPDHVLAQVGLSSNCSQPPRQRLGSGSCPRIGGIVF